MTSVAVLGTGIMGAPMARNLLRAGITVRAWNRSPDKAEPLARDGAVVADHPGAAADGADVVVTMLTDADATLSVAAEAVREGAVWAQMGTIGLEGTERAAALAARAGASFFDAPVLGTRRPAEEGKLVVLASGPEAGRDALAPVFDAVGARTLWLGAAGEGTRLKLVANAYILSILEGLAETIALAEGMGVDPERFLEAIAGGLMDSGYAQLKGKAMIGRDFEASFALSGAAKDARLITAAAARHELELPLLAAIAERLADGVARGNGDLDMAATFLTSAR